MTQIIIEGYFIEEISKLGHKVICLLILYSTKVCEHPDDKNYIFVRHGIR